MSVRAARRRRLAIAPQLAVYDDDKHDRVIWPLVTRTAKPGFASAVMNVDSRGHRLTTVDGQSARSDDAPDDAGFLIGGSYVLGVGATNDGGTPAASLWRRTGIPFVNLGIGAACSAQELVTALPFAHRPTTFVVCSGVNNFWLSHGMPGLDPQFGPTFNDSRHRRLAAVPIRALVAAAEGAGAVGERELAAELKRRAAKRIRGRLRRRHPTEASKPRPRRKGTVEQSEAVAAAARLQLRDLRTLRRIVPTEAKVVFALQPTAFSLTELSPEEEQLFAALDEIQGARWKRRRRMFETQWAGFAAAIEEGCAELGVPFIDLAHGEYEGWCWVDRVHMTDRGYDAAAKMIAETLNADR